MKGRGRVLLAAAGAVLIVGAVYVGEQRWRRSSSAEQPSVPGLMQIWSRPVNEWAWRADCAPGWRGRLLLWNVKDGVEAFDEDDGRVVWADDNVGSDATAVLQGDSEFRVFAGAGEMRPGPYEYPDAVAALDEWGTYVWMSKFPEYLIKGMAANEKRVFAVVCDDPGPQQAHPHAEPLYEQNPRLLALDARTGREVWRKPIALRLRKDDQGEGEEGEVARMEASREFVAIELERYYRARLEWAVHVIDVTSGKEVIWLEIGGADWELVEEGLVLADDSVVQMRSLPDGAVSWRVNLASEVVSESLRVVRRIPPDPGIALLLTEDGRLHAVETSTGCRVWSVPTASTTYQGTEQRDPSRKTHLELASAPGIAAVLVRAPSHTTSLQCFSTADGRLLARRSWESDESMSLEAVSSGGTLFCLTTRNMRVHLVAYRGE